MRIFQKKSFSVFSRKFFISKKKYCFFEKISCRSEIFQRFQKSHLEMRAMSANSVGAQMKMVCEFSTLCTTFFDQIAPNSSEWYLQPDRLIGFPNFTYQSPIAEIFSPIGGVPPLAHPNSTSGLAKLGF